MKNLSNASVRNFRFAGILVVVSFFISFNAIAQSSLEKAWSSFSTNDLVSAKTNFTNALTDADSKAEAYLGLAILASEKDDSKTAFTQFVNFFNASKDPVPYTYALWNSILPQDVSAENPEKEKFLKQLAEKTDIDGTIKAMTHTLLGAYYDNIREFKTATEEYNKIGASTDWQIVGVFENISGSGFDKNYDPITYPDKTKAFKNKYNADVYWFDVNNIRSDKWIDFTYNFYIKNTIVFAQSFVESPSDQEIQLRIGTSGSLKAWINDALVFSESEERNNDIDTYVTKVKLKKGYNRVVLQVGASDIDRLNFMVRYTDNDGNPVAGLTSTKTAQTYKKETNATPVVVENFAEKYFKEQVVKNPKSLLNYLMLAETYLRNEKTYEARKALLKAKEIAPTCSYIYYKLISVYLKEKNNTDLTTSLEWMKDNDPDSYFSLILLYQDEIDKENYTKAEEILKKMEKLHGVSEYTTQKWIELTAYNKEQEKMMTMIDAAYKKYPDNYTFVTFKHVVQTDVQKNYKDGIATLKKYLKSHYSDDVMETLADDYFNSGMLTEGLAAYNTLIERNPASSGYLRTMGNIYSQLQNYTEAIKWYKKALDIAPYVGSWWGDLAKAYENNKNESDAISAYKKSIVFLPTNYEDRKSLRKLEGDKEIFDYFDSPDVYALCKKAPDATAYPEDNSLILLEEVQRVVYGGGASEEKHIYVVKVFNADGVKYWKNYSIYYTNMQRVVIEKAEVVKASGSKVTAETNDADIVFTSLEPGDAIHITYKIENYSLGKLSPYFWDKHYFSSGVPKLDSKYCLLIPPDVTFKTKFSQKDITPVVTDLKEFKMYTWENKDQASIKYEDKMPEFSDVANIMFLSSFPDWTYISNWYYDISSTKAKSDFEVKETVADLFKGKESLTQLQKVREIYNFIVNNIRYNSVAFLQSGLIPQKASNVLNTKIGDCKDVSTLFVAMCKEIGVTASLVLVDTRDNGKKDMLLPSIDFNHCIAKATIDSKDYYVELTSDFLPFNSIDDYLTDAISLDIVNEADKKTVEAANFKATVRAPNVVSRVTKITIDGSDIVIDKDNYKTGIFAANMRKNFRDIGAKEQEKSMLESLSGDYPNIQMNSLDFKNLKSNSDTVSFTYNYTGFNALTEVTGLSLFSLPWASKADSKDFTFNKKREYPFDLYRTSYYDSDVETIYITIPTGKVLAEIPKSLNYTCTVADYSLTFKLNKNILEVKRDLKYKQNTIPLDKIDEFSEFYKKVISADTKQIAIK